MERIRSDRILTENGVRAGYVYIENGRIAAVTAQELSFDREWDRTGLIVSPGFVELHTHGGAGHDFMGSAADIVAGCNFHLEHGATTVCPSLSAAPFFVLALADCTGEAADCGASGEMLTFEASEEP